MKLKVSLMSLFVLGSFSVVATENRDELLKNAKPGMFVESAVRNEDGSVTFTGIKLQRGNKVRRIGTDSSAALCHRLGYPSQGSKGLEYKAEEVIELEKENGSFASYGMSYPIKSITCFGVERKIVIKANMTSRNPDGSVTFKNVRLSHFGVGFSIDRDSAESVCNHLDYEYLIDSESSSNGIYFAYYGSRSEKFHLMTDDKVSAALIETVTCSKEEI